MSASGRLGLRLSPFALVLAGALLGTGCGQRDAYPVRGRVLYEGKPAVGAVVFLHPVDLSEPTRSRPSGRVGKDGSFSISTPNLGDGAKPGEYLVTVVWRAEAGPGDSEEDEDLLPARYLDPKTSGLRITVKAGANDLEPFDLRP
jgi:hypothetical protein